MASSNTSNLQKGVKYGEIKPLSKVRPVAGKLIRRIIALQDILDREPYSISVEEELDSALELFYHIIRTAKKKGFSIPKITTLGCCLVRTKRGKLSNVPRMEIVSKNGQYRITRASRNGIPTYQFVQITQPTGNDRSELVWFCSLNTEKKPRI
jgi:hypothetical protein